LENRANRIMNNSPNMAARTNIRWVICTLLFFATTVNYVDRAVLGILKKTLDESLHWTQVDYGNVVTASTDEAFHDGAVAAVPYLVGANSQEESLLRWLPGLADVFLAAAMGPAGFHKLQVVKRLRPHLAEDPDLAAMFLDEARLAARLNHRNVVQTNEVDLVDGQYFMAMEYLDGQPLHRVVAQARKAAFRSYPAGQPGRGCAPTRSNAAMTRSKTARTSEVGAATGLSSTYPIRNSLSTRRRGGGRVQDQAFRSHPSGPPRTARAAIRSAALRAMGPATAKPVENPGRPAPPPGMWPLMLTRSRVGLWL